MRGICVDLDLECNAVVLDISLLRVQNLVPGHIVREAPVVLFAVEHVGNLPGELLPAPLVDQAEVGGGVARPGARLRLSVTLKKESNTFRVTVLMMKSINTYFI